MCILCINLPKMTVREAGRALAEFSVEPDHIGALRERILEVHGDTALDQLFEFMMEAQQLATWADDGGAT